MPRQKKRDIADYSLTLNNLYTALYENKNNLYTEAGAVFGLRATLTGEKLDKLLNQGRPDVKMSEQEPAPFMSNRDYSRVLDLYSKTSFTKAGSQKLFFIAHLWGWRSANVVLSQKTDVIFNGNNRPDGGVRAEFCEDLVSWACSVDGDGNYIFFKRNDSVGKALSEKTSSIAKYIVACNQHLISRYCDKKDLLIKVMAGFSKNMMRDEENRNKGNNKNLTNLCEGHKAEMELLKKNLTSLLKAHTSSVDEQERELYLARAITCLLIGAMLRESMTCEVLRDIFDSFLTKEKMKSYFSIIIPVNRVGSKPNAENADERLNSDLLISPINITPQLTGSPLLTGEHPSLYARYALAQKQRRSIGLHGNENHKYLLAKEEIPFQIGKIFLWVFRGPVSFITFQVIAENLYREQILNLVSGLCNIKNKPKITYEESVAKNVTKCKMITLKDILENILKLPQFISFERTEESLQRAYCLYYSVGRVEDKESLSSFLEMIRWQTKSVFFSSQELEKDYGYQPGKFKHIKWAVSPYTVACVASENIARPEAREYINNKGGLRQSIFTNYQLVYLNCLAVDIRLKMLQKQYSIFHPTALNNCPGNVRKELLNILNIPLEKLTTEDHINTLFDKYLCANVFGLQDKLKGLSQANMLDTIEDIARNIESKK